MAEAGSNVILCGFMGTGKSSVGRRLAALIDFDFVDLDDLIEAAAGTPIAEIFAARGEPAFREMESRMVESVAARTRCVVATGGGAIVNPRNLETLKRCGAVITLTADIPTILARVGTGDDRPLLRAPDRVERIRALLEQRAYAYAQADLTVDTSTLSIDEVAREIISRLGLTPASR